MSTLAPRILGHVRGVGMGATIHLNPGVFRLTTGTSLAQRRQYYAVAHGIYNTVRRGMAVGTVATLFQRAASYLQMALAGLPSGQTAVQYANNAVPAAGSIQGFTFAHLAVRQAYIVLYNSGLAGLPHVGIGALNASDPDLVASASLLDSFLSTNGCSQSSVPEVVTFQKAWNAAGGSPTLAIDGLYGAHTAAALQAEFTAGNLQTASGGPLVAGCVAAAPKGGGGTIVTPPGSTVAPTQSVTVNPSNMLPIALATVAGAGLIGWAVYAKKRRRIIHRPAHRLHYRLAR